MLGVVGSASRSRWLSYRCRSRQGDRTRGAITRYIHGDRGRGDFPASINPGARHELYRWLQVQAWFDDTKTSVDIAAVDIAIRLRQQLINAPNDIRELCLDVVLAR